MLFSSMIFLWVFLPIVLAVNFLFSALPFKKESSRIRVKNIFLLIASLIFYAWGGIYYLLIMLSSILLNFAGGYVLEKGVKTKGARRAAFIVIIVLNIAILFFFKYFNMLIAIIESLIQPGAGFREVWQTMLSMKGTGTLNLAQIVLPIGISFFTFQAMSYVMDVYMGKANLQENIIDFALYVSLFPQLIAGPIVKYSDVDLQLQNRKETLELFVSGQKRFCYGLGKKVLVSNVLAKVADDIWALEIENLGAAVAWLGIIAYTLQIYFDFSGYSDMAIGIALLLGFRFPKNFDAPYKSATITEFWRRWHISLSSWLRDYLYISLGGNRKGRLRTYGNLLLTMLLGGLWHGAAIRFILWGALHGVALALHKLWLTLIPNAKIMGSEMSRGYRIAGIFLTFNIVCFGWLMFRAGSMQTVTLMLHQIAFNFNAAMIPQVLSGYAGVFILIGCGYLLHLLPAKIDSAAQHIVVHAPMIFQVLLATVMIWSVMQIKSSDIQPFIYFQF